MIHNTNDMSNIFDTADHQSVQQFLSRLSSVFGFTVPPAQVLENIKSNNHPGYEVSAIVEIPIPCQMKKFLSSENSNLIKVSAGTRAKTISEARRLVSRNLARIFYSILDGADAFLPSKGINLNSARPFINLAIEYDARSDLKEAIDDCNAILDDLSAESDLSPKQITFSLQAEAPKTELDSKEHLKGSLPIYKFYQKILESVFSNQVTILSASTGSGKTTQIPKMLLHHFSGSVIVTQPRRVAAISLAHRLAHELDENALGSSVGYNVRFEAINPDPTRPNILFCTSGLLLKKLQSGDDVFLSKCTHLVLDEIHERDVNTDILLLISKEWMRRNPSLKLIIMSATMDAQKFHDYFAKDGFEAGSPIKMDSGTNFPVSSFSLEDAISLLKGAKMFPLRISGKTKDFLEKELNGGESEGDADIPIEVVSSLLKYIHVSKPDGSILCFLPGWEEICAVEELLTSQFSNSSQRFRTYCLHSSSSSEVSQSIFQATPGVRKIILATNIAESSITIPDVAYVVDCGRQKINSYNAALRMTSLETCWISHSNSIQRLGRVGRTQPGEYYLLCSRDRELVRTFPPEILRIGLEEVCLALKSFGLPGKCSDIASKLIDCPARDALKESVKMLTEIGALDPFSENITSLGLQLSRLPLHPKMSHSLLLAHKLGSFDDMLMRAAAVGERVIRIPRDDANVDKFSRFMRKVRSQFEDDHSFLKNLHLAYCNGVLNGAYRNDLQFLSMNSLKRVSAIKRNLESYFLKLSQRRSFQNWQNLSFSDFVCRFLLMRNGYPEVAYQTDKRNTFLVSKGVTAESKKDSILFNDSLESIVSSGIDITCLKHSPCLIFEELFDAGFKMLVRGTKVDAAFCALFAKNVRVSNLNMVIDNFAVISFEKLEDLSVFVDLRLVLDKAFKEVLRNEAPETLQTSILKVLQTLEKIWNVDRPITFKSPE